jgi:flavodoxin I
MNKIGLFYSFNTHKTSKIAEKIIAQFGPELIEGVNAETVTSKSFLSYNNLILGVPTWFDGELPNYWDEFIPALEDFDLKGKKIAIFGLGDQKNYAENFLDGMGIMSNILLLRGAEIVGFTSSDGYIFEKSKAFSEGKFCGLGIDFENQQQFTDERVSSWVHQLRSEFGV